MSIPAWADKTASEELGPLRKRGEGQELEYKEAFPQQAHNLATEIAAFATVGGGTILIGVRNNGDLAGLDAPNEDERDDLVHRAQGIVRTVRPAVKHEILLASEEDKLVLVIRIGEQDEPMFYYEYRPYIRDGRTSRPAEPDEVIGRIHAHPSAEFKREKERLEMERARDELERERRHRARMEAIMDR